MFSKIELVAQKHVELKKYRIIKTHKLKIIEVVTDYVFDTKDEAYDEIRRLNNEYKNGEEEKND